MRLGPPEALSQATRHGRYLHLWAHSGHAGLFPYQESAPRPAQNGQI